MDLLKRATAAICCYSVMSCFSSCNGLAVSSAHGLCRGMPFHFHWYFLNRSILYDPLQDGGRR